MYIPNQLVNQQSIAHADSLLRANVGNRVQTLVHMSWEERLRMVGSDLLNVGWKIVVAVAIVIVGRWLIKRLVAGIDRVMKSWKIDPALRAFMRSAVKTVLWFVLFYVLVSWLGVNTSIFVALFAAAGLAIGMAMGGVFQNMAGGVVVLITKPFRCGDWVELQGLSGRVVDIRLLDPVLRTADNRTVTMPNGGVATSVMTNHTAARTRRLEWAVSLNLSSDFAAAQKLIMEILAADKKVLTDPASEVVLNLITSDSIDILAHGWVATKDYWEVYFRINAAIYETLTERGFDMGTVGSIKISMEQGEND